VNRDTFRGPEPSVPLIPFIDTLSSAVEAALRALLDLGESISLRWHYRDDAASDWHVHAVIEDDLEFDIYPGEAANVHSWIKTHPISLAYREARNVDADDDARKHILVQLHRRLQRLAVTDNGAAFVHLRAAIDEFGPFNEMSDFMFRSVSPHEAVIRLGFQCNQDCGFCWQGRQWPAPPGDYYDQWLDEFAKAGCSEITFTGGEPTISRDLPRLIERASKEHGMGVCIQTNAIRLRKRDFAESIVRAGLTRAFVSYHSHIPDVSDALTRAPGTHRPTEAGIRMLLDLGVRVDLNCVVERQNYEHLADLSRHIVSEFVTPFGHNPVQSVQYSHPSQYYSAEAWRESVVAFDELQGHLLEAISVLETAGTAVEVVGTCGFPPCVFHDAPSVLRRVVREEQAENDVLGRVFADVCGECARQSGCLGVRREYLDVYGDRGLKPFRAP